MSAEAFDAHRYLNLATFRKSGAEVKTPVWFAAREGKLYAFTAGGSGKVKRLRNGSRARIAPCDLRGNVTGEWRDTQARIVDDPALCAQAHAALRAKYGLVMALTDAGAWIAGRIRKRVFLEIDF